MPPVPKICPVSDLRNKLSDISKSEIYPKLKEAEYQSASVKKRYTHSEVMIELRKVISGK